jgi:hypothetical protein
MDRGVMPAVLNSGTFCPFVRAFCPAFTWEIHHGK